MSQTELSETIRTGLEAIAESSGCELLEAQFRGGVLRLVIDRVGGVTLDECQTVSKQASALLDVEDFGSSRYVLEVSSPGLDRKFYSSSDYERFCGREVRVTWKEREMEHKKTVVGTLAEYVADERQIVLESSETEDSYRISLEDILLTRLEPEI